MSSDGRVLVVGTTGDYVDWIARRAAGRALFLTDRQIRMRSAEPAPPGGSEVLADLSDFAASQDALCRHLEQSALALTGVACFDDESMLLAARLAQRFSLPYPSAETVALCRDKHGCKQAWAAADVPTPRASLVRGVADAVSFSRDFGAPCVLKPLSGSGSELVSLCRGRRETAAAFRNIRSGLRDRAGDRMYAGAERPGCQPLLAEEYVEGREFSCDFVIDAGRAAPIRVAEKVLARNAPLGTARGYVIPSMLPPEMDRGAFVELLTRAARAVGIRRAICMLDFIVRDGQAMLLEIAPRPGGDCLPCLIRHSSGLDMLLLALDFAEGLPVTVPDPSQWRRMVGLRIRAHQAGTLRNIDAAPLARDRRVREVQFYRGAGHTIVLPPADYNSWILGHVIFQPDGDRDVETQCDEVLGGIDLEIAA